MAGIHWCIWAPWPPRKILDAEKQNWSKEKCVLEKMGKLNSPWSEHEQKFESTMTANYFRMTWGNCITHCIIGHLYQRLKKAGGVVWWLEPVFHNYTFDLHNSYVTKRFPFHMQLWITASAKSLNVGHLCLSHCRAMSSRIPAVLKQRLQHSFPVSRPDLLLVNHLTDHLLGNAG